MVLVVGFGARATSRERLQLVARLTDRPGHVTWASTASQADRWLGSRQA